MKNCNNCAWFCHRDRKCYGLAVERYKVAIFCCPTDPGCERWDFDGLEDWEREPDALVTMEMEK